jgi:SAM-dependent methyltransferase
MRQKDLNQGKGKYVLATGRAASNRLRILHSIYGPGARRVLLDAGIKPGMRVADLGCGVGMTTALLAELVGPEGEVVGVDISADQVAQARELLPPKFANVTFVAATATETGLPTASFDLVYSRFLLIHLTEPEAALSEKHRLLKPGGTIVVEDGDLTTAGSEPATALNMFSDLWGGLGPKWGVDYTIGRRLFQMVRGADFRDVEITYNQPVFARGENKRLADLSIAEAGQSFVTAGLITREALDVALAEMARAAHDENILAVMPKMSQVWGRKAG